MVMAFATPLYGSRDPGIDSLLKTSDCDHSYKTNNGLVFRQYIKVHDAYSLLSSTGGAAFATLRISATVMARVFASFP
jgi:hypothetical protein